MTYKVSDEKGKTIYFGGTPLEIVAGCGEICDPYAIIWSGTCVETMTKTNSDIPLVYQMDFIEGRLHFETLRG